MENNTETQMTTHQTPTESYQGLGRAERRRMKRRWRQEGGGLSLKDWARKMGVGDAALNWLEHKREAP